MADEREMIVDNTPAVVARFVGRPVRATVRGEHGSTVLLLTFAEADELRHELAAFLAASGEPLANACPVCGAQPGYRCNGTREAWVEHSARWNERKAR